MRRRQNQQVQPGVVLGGFGLPGQREVVRVDERSDYALVLKQWGALTVYLAFAFLLAVANILIIGPWLGFSAGIVASFIFAIWLTAALRNTSLLFVGIIVGLSIIVTWLIFGMSVVEILWWDVRCDWHIRNKALFSAFSALMLVATGLPVYRFSYEIVDPRWPPTVSIREADWGPLWPWAQIPQGDEPETERIEVIREIPRPVPTPQNGRTNVLPERPPDPSRVGSNGQRTIICPTSGREVQVTDLVSFIRLAPDITPSFRVWKQRGWKHERWKDVVDVWATYGVVNGRESRKTVKILEPDFSEAMGRLSSAFD